MIRPVLTLVALTAMTPAAAAQGHAHQSGELRLYDNLGDHHYPITTAVPMAQRYFDQGLRWSYGFNHPEAIKAFQEAERLDPECAMCAWGVAYAAGPNINGGMDSASGVLAYQAIRRAVARAGRATPVEQALIGALAERYAADPSAARPPLDSAYATAMSRVAKTFPDDPDMQVLSADALMNLSPWYYWTKEGTPRPDTPRILGRLEGVLAANPVHPGACHFYIHAVEARHPERAVACAERLAALMPGAGHIVHMPGHIYIRVGRWHDAIEANRHAVHADETYLEGPVAQRGIYAEGYYPHNYHFMSFAASMAGDGTTAIYAARRVAEKISPEVARTEPWLEAITPVVYYALVTFGRWDEILASPLPPADLRFTTTMAYYAKGIAFAAKGLFVEAAAALDTVTAINSALPADDNRIAAEIAGLALRGEIALRQGDASAAVAAFTEARDKEDALTYVEPPTWYYPIRHSLGKALLAAGQPAEAERAYREDLARFPNNGWSLFGLAESLERQGKAAEAAKTRAAFEDAWRGADITLEASRL